MNKYFLRLVISSAIIAAAVPFFAAPVHPAQAADEINSNLNSQGPCAAIQFGSKGTWIFKDLRVTYSGRPIDLNQAMGYCVVEIYKWSLGIAVILALIMIVLSGYTYMTSGGNAQKVTTAKEMFAGAFIGLIILFAAVLILRTINPELANFRGLNI